MLPEISLHILDIAQNSIRAGASLTEIDVREEGVLLTVVIRDNGCGMSPEMVARVTDPFTTSRTTRKVGLGVPFYKMAAEITGGTFSIGSTVGVGTTVTAVFHTDHIDCMPLGGLSDTIYALVTLNPGIDFLFTHTVNGKSMTMDTREFRAVLGDVGFDDPDVKQYIREYLDEMNRELHG
ncbi:MAG: ATP-binding protein [Clostridiaceae bacterium]|nr:ATP-binding protein [Clostridiaceae bacterium]